MKPLFYLFASLILFTILLFSCRDDIEFKTPDSIQDAIFIEGKLTKGDPSFVQVTQANSTTEKPEWWVE